MSDKETRTVSLDPENNEFLADHDNASALVDDLVDEYRRTGDRGTAGLKLQLKQKRREYENKLDEVERLEQDMDEIEALIAGKEKHVNAQLEEAKDVLSEVPRDPTNPGIKNWAKKLDMEPEELIEELD